jgi:hypothetical protein
MHDNSVFFKKNAPCLHCLKKNAYISAAFNPFFHPKPKKDEVQNFIPNCPPLWALILIAMCGFESYAQEGGHLPGNGKLCKVK